MAKPIIALMYDFDSTLSTTDMQEYAFIKNLDMTPKEFWSEAGKLTKEYGVERILAYMYVMVKECKKKGIKLTEEYLNECGKNIVFFKGVTTWFDRINEYANSIGAQVEHYIISSGTSEIVMGSEIAKYFKKIYGCKFLYDDNGEAIWPSMAINYTLKTQYIFRIGKGVLDEFDDDNLNKHSESRRIPYENMIYLGDGLTDIPCMKLLREKGGKSIALYPSGNKKRAMQLVQDKRINYVTVADYSPNSTLEKIVKMMIDNMVSYANLKEREEKQIAAFTKTTLEGADED